MNDITPSNWSAWSAAVGATPVDFGTRPCGICGERVRVTLSGAWREYHDCKPVPGARLEQAERERDEAQQKEKWLRGVCDELAAESIQRKERLEQAVALLREAPDKACDCEEGRTCGSCEYNTRKDAFLTGQPAPVKLTVDDAMVERARAAMWGDDDFVHPADQRNDMRAALVAALEGRT